MSTRPILSRSSSPDLSDLLSAFDAKPLYEHLVKHIRAAEAALAEDENLLTQFYLPNGESITVGSLGYHEPALLIVEGKNGLGQQFKILAHINTVQIALTVHKTGKEEPKRRSIGFMGNVGTES